MIFRAMILTASMAAAGAAETAAETAAPPAVDGWTGASATLTLTQASEVAPLAIHGIVPDLPGGAFHPTLKVSVDGVEAASAALAPGEFELRSVVVGKPGPHVIGIAFDPVRALPAPDARPVGAQLLRVAFENLGPAGSSWAPMLGGGQQQDICVSGGAVGLGAGWFICEHWQGLTFRWMPARAEIALAPATGQLRLSIEAEAGPCAPAGGADLRVLDAGMTLIDKVHVNRHATHDVILVVPPAAKQPLILAIDKPLDARPADPRQLCIRVFAITATDFVPPAK